jgi:hypothetical protein
MVTQNPRGLGHAQTIFNELTVVSLTRWWPPVGVLTMLLLGWVVGTGSTPVDNWFSRDAREAIGEHPGWLLVFTGWWVLAPVLAACAGVALYYLTVVTATIWSIRVVTQHSSRQCWEWWCWWRAADSGR